VLPGAWTDGGAIDAEVFTDTDGTPYLLWKNDGNSASGSGDVSLWAKELASNGLSFADSSDPVELLAYDPATWENGDLDLIEQPEMILREGTYYLFYSGNAFDDKDYAEGYAVCPDGPTAACDKVTDGAENPWFAGRSSTHTDAEFETSVGHGPGAVTFFADENSTGSPDGPGGTWMAYHAWPTEDAAGSPTQAYRAMHIERAVFDGDSPAPNFFYPLALRGMADLGDLGYGLSVGKGVSDDFSITGYALPDTDPPYHAVLWTAEDGWDDWGTFSSDSTQAERVNKSRHFVGSTFTDFNDPETHEATRWVEPHNSYDLLQPLANGEPSEAYGINEAGYTVGVSYEHDGEWRPAIWYTWGEVQKLFDDNDIEAGSYTAEAFAINEHGEIAGYYCYYIGCEQRGFVYHSPSDIDEIGNLGEYPTRAYDINIDGLTVGCSTTTQDETHAFIWDEFGGMDDLFETANVGDSCALGINDRGQVVGYYFTGTGQSGLLRAFLYDPELGLWDIGDIDPDATTESFATDINNYGVITGWSIVDGEAHAFFRGTSDHLGQP